MVFNQSTITESIILEKGIYVSDDGTGIVIRGENITVDGRGAVLQGYGECGKGIDSFKGTGITIEGSRNIILKNIIVKGFCLGMHIKDSCHVTVQDSDFSDNYTNPEYGWGDGFDYGAIFLDHSDKCVIKGCKGVNVWNGIYLKYSHDNLITGNDFSHCSNTCLSMWGAKGNTVQNNNLSWGLRIKPGEVHARDSAGVLIEHGSNNNTIIGNDCTHGGDGTFIRSNDKVISTGNIIERNDCSYANNNAVECWSPGNTFRKNVACHSSYGFWMGGSDDTLMEDNEIAYNGTNFRNAPTKEFGNAGVSVLYRSSTHFRLIGNKIHNNEGAGVGVFYKEDCPAYHWLISNNTIINNSGYGIYLKDSKLFYIEGNIIEDNGKGDIYKGSNVTDVTELAAGAGSKPPVAKACVSANMLRLGEDLFLDASASTDPCGKKLEFKWDLGDGSTSDAPVFRHMYESPGFYKVCLTVGNGQLSDTAGFNIYVYTHGEMG